MSYLRSKWVFSGCLALSLILYFTYTRYLPSLDGLSTKGNSTNDVMLAYITLSASLVSLLTAIASLLTQLLKMKKDKEEVKE